MFSPTSSPYSPFFTSGLLSQPLLASSSSPSSSRSPSPEIPLGPRRGSLPTDSPARLPSADDASAFYFTLQQRDESKFRSFLSLDLAESQSMRSASLKRKVSGRSRTTAPSARLAARLAFPGIPEDPHYLAPSPTTLRLRRSRESMRTIPSPKPAPSATLPDLPKDTTVIACAPPRLPSIPVIPSLDFSLKRTSAGVPSIAASPTASVSKPVPNSHRASTLTQATSSTVSTRVRKFNRSDALARLEGRSELPRVPCKRTLQSNFMSMSDDEDEDDSDDDSVDFFDSADTQRKTFLPAIEPEDVVLPTITISGRLRGTSVSNSHKRRHAPNRTTKDWFPLKSFIDLRNDDDSSRWSWRSFIEVASVS
ncbi:hypothetical protein BDQ12DRAFT_665172 [Crucibulum laeve]|uniref:Uncharacterized protein n=1 Tax=Crucibulum laeve TaxID=68775 RepID=A0A5C3M513_9AGAR|nr:hypothetical protein BDQ12DRAFT_665172 [Crucibulum laeve]